MGGGYGQLERDFLDLFGFETRQVSLETNQGPGVARQAGLDAARGEYVMFCDADDTLHNVGALGAMIQEAEKNAPDMLTSEWLEELIDPTGKYLYITHQIENTWMHGKLLRRQFLLRNNIRFHSELRIHEDSYFLCIAAALAQRANHLPATSYVWKYRPSSITRRNGSIYTYESMPTFIQALSMAFREVEKRAPEQMEYRIAQFTLYNYFSYHRPEWLAPEHAEYRAAAETAFADYMKPFWHYWQNAPRELISKVYNEERLKSFAGGIEAEALARWLERIGMDTGNMTLEG